MNKEEIKEYLKRVDELEAKLTGEDKETLQWLIYGYNQCAKLLNETEQENKQLKAKLEMYENGVYYSSENDKLKEVIEEVREYIEDWLFNAGGNGASMNYEDINELLKILDKAKGDSNE